MPEKDELESMMMSRHTPNVHNKLKEGRVAIAGLGGLGSNIAIMHARIGVGNLLLVDFDVVEPSNLNRQSYYINHLGMEKTAALKMQLQQINPFITIETRTVRVTEDNVCELFKGYDIVCEAFDKRKLSPCWSILFWKGFRALRLWLPQEWQDMKAQILLKPFGE
jgi:sulfur carrier protein ThiS adenylyltransferase